MALTQLHSFGQNPVPIVPVPVGDIPDPAQFRAHFDETEKLNDTTIKVDRETVEAEALLRAKRSPTNGKAGHHIIIGVTQIAHIQPGRQTITIFNASASLTVAFSKNGLAGNEYFTLSTTATASMDTEDEVWITNGSNDPANAATVETIITFYDLDDMAIAKGKKSREHRVSSRANIRDAG